jgi:hypothetical protein
MPDSLWRAIRFKNQFLLAVMEKLAGDAMISFEGDLSGVRLFDIPGASIDETQVLKRNTLSPRQGFVVLPLEADTVQPILRAVGGTIPRSIIHIQIAKRDRLEFGAYDRFNPVTLVLGPALDVEFLNFLQKQGFLEPNLRQPVPVASNVS